MALSRASGSNYVGQKRGHAHPMYNVPFIVRPVNTITAGNLADADGTSIGKWFCPDFFGECLVLAIGFNYAAAGGAQTVAGDMKVEIAGDVITVDGSTLLCTSVASHAASDCVEQNCNDTTSTETLSAAPSFPKIAGGQLLEWKVGKQGTGAGDRTVHPYAILVRRPSQS